MPPYRSKAARARPWFLDVREARDEICTEDGCSLEEALSQIRDMLVDDVIEELCWGSEPDSDEPPPKGSRHWRVVDINPVTGEVTDDFAWVAWNAVWGPGGPRYDDAPIYAPPEPVTEWRILFLDKVSFRAARRALRPSEEKEADRAARRQGKIGPLLANTYPKGLPSNLSSSEIRKAVKAKTGQTISRGGLYTYLTRPKRTPDA